MSDMRGGGMSAISILPRYHHCFYLVLFAQTCCLAKFLGAGVSKDTVTVSKDGYTELVKLPFEWQQRTTNVDFKIHIAQKQKF